METLGERLKLARETAGFTQQSLADQCKLTKGAISQIETGGNGIAGDNVFPIADTLGISARWLMTGKGEMRVYSDASSVPEKVQRIAYNLNALPNEKLQALSIVLGIKL